MNNVIYKLSSRFLTDKEKLEILNNNVIEYLYNFYQQKSQILKIDININRKEFQNIFECINNVLILKVSEDDCYEIEKHYLILLMADALDGNIVDVKWFIEHIWYLCVGITNDIDKNKYKDCIPFIQLQLIKQFSIEEKLKEKIVRKIYTRILIKQLSMYQFNLKLIINNNIYAYQKTNKFNFLI